MASRPNDEEWWARTPGGKVILRLIEQWDAGVTEHGDIALSFTSTLGNDPGIPSGAPHRSQFICTQQDAREIAHTILRTLAFAQTGEDPGFTAYRNSIQSPALRALADHWNKARGTRRMPAFADIRQESIAPHLGHLWAFDYDRKTGAFTGRLAGSSIMQIFGKSFFGMPLHELHPGPAFEPAHAALMRTVSEPACSRWSGGLYKAGDVIYEGERLILPMGADADRPDGVLGACWFENPPQFRPGDHVEVLHDRVEWCRI
jgi:hypothetical protein